MKSETSKRDRWYAIAGRVILGAIFLMSGVETFIPFLTFNIMPSSAFAVLGEKSGYFFQTLKLTEVLLGACLVGNFFAPLSLLLLFPITINILLYSIFINLSNLPVAIFLLGLQIALVIYYRKIFYVFLKPQLYSHPWQEETAHVLVLEEVEEKLPSRAKEVQNILSALDELDHKNKKSFQT